MSDSSLNLWDLPSISAPIMGCYFIVIMSPHEQFDRQFTIHKEVQILTKKQERRTTNLDDTPLYSHANLLSCLFILLYSDFLHLRLYFSFVFLHINLKCICPAAVPATMVPTFAATFAPSFAATLAVSLDASFAAVLAVSFCFLLGMDHHRLVIDLFNFQFSHLLSTSITQKRVKK